MTAAKARQTQDLIDSVLDEVRCESDGDSTSCEVDAMVQMGDVYVLMVSEIDDDSEDTDKDDLWPFIR